MTSHGSIPAAGSASGPRRTAESSDTPAPFSQSHRVKGAKTDGLAAGCIVAGGSSRAGAPPRGGAAARRMRAIEATARERADSHGPSLYNQKC